MEAQLKSKYSKFTHLLVNLNANLGQMIKDNFVDYKGVRTEMVTDPDRDGYIYTVFIPSTMEVKDGSTA